MNRSLNVVLHAHSLWSYDGQWDLAKISSFFGNRGVDAVMMTEHDTGFDPARYNEYREACEIASTETCTLIPGIEYSSPDNDIHILTWGIDGFLAEHRPVLETLQRVKDLGGAAIFAHPIRRQAFLKFEDAFVPYLDGIEVWNRKSDGIAPCKEAKEIVRRTKLAATVGVDFHYIRHYWPLTHKVEVAGEDLQTELVKAVREQRLQPMLASRGLLNAKGEVNTPVSDTLELVRKSLKRFIPGKTRPKGDRLDRS